MSDEQRDDRKAAEEHARWVNWDSLEGENDRD